MLQKKDFTDRMLRSLKAAESGKRYIRWDAAVPGFGIRITDRCSPDAVGSFVLVMRFPGGKNPVARRIGDYPPTSLADARAKAREWRAMVRGGIDPAIKMEQERRTRQHQIADTFEALFGQYAERHLATLRTGKVVEQVVRRAVVPKWGSWPIADIRRRHVIDLIDEIAEGTPTNANRILAYLKHFLRWCVDRDRLEISPAESVKRPSKEARRDRVLSDEEISAFWEATDDMGAFSRAFRFMLVTGQRRTEVGALRWSEVDLKKSLWLLPQGRTKADRAHEVPLAKVAREILDACPKLAGCDFPFTTGRLKRDTNGEPDLQPVSGWGKAKDRLDLKMLEILQRRADEAGAARRAKLPAWHLHDLRRTAATNLSKLGTDRIVVARILNHADREVTGIYDRHRYDNEKRSALDLWGECLLQIARCNLQNAVTNQAAAE